MDGQVVRLPAKVNNEHFAAGEALIVDTTWGGGIGEPEERPVAEVLADLAAHRVTPEAVQRDYGVVLLPEGTAAEEATARLRLSRLGG